MIVQYVAGSSLAELRQATPRSAFSTSTGRARRPCEHGGVCLEFGRTGVKRLSEVLACELLIASEALEHASLSAHVQGLVHCVRTVLHHSLEIVQHQTELRQLSSLLRKGGWLRVLKPNSDAYRDDRMVSKSRATCQHR